MNHESGCGRTMTSTKVILGAVNKCEERGELCQEKGRQILSSSRKETRNRV